ncbi:MAG: hypothetical protein ACR2H1_11070 [Limisphaerales bacterium]
MNTDDFEKRLQQQTVRPIPREWRREILQQATGVSSYQLKTQNSKLKTFLSELLWPCPQAWAGLAAVWIVIFAISYDGQDHKTKTAKASPPSPEVILALKEQRRLYLELAELHPTEKAESPKSATPGPRSESKITFETV